MLSTQFKVRTATDPFHVVLTKRGTNWDEDVQKGRDEDEMNARLFSIDAVSHKTKEDTYQDKWKDRNPRSKPKPRYTEHGTVPGLSLIHISEPTRLLSISYAVFCL